VQACLLAFSQLKAQHRQFNVRIAPGLKRRLELEKAHASTTKDIIAELALEAWFTKYPLAQRIAFYRAHERKPYARRRLTRREVSARIDAHYLAEVGGLEAIHP
jgi:hypothetical protein